MMNWGQLADWIGNGFVILGVVFLGIYLYDKLSGGKK